MSRTRETHVPVCLFKCAWSSWKHSWIMFYCIKNKLLEIWESEEISPQITVLSPARVVSGGQIWQTWTRSSHPRLDRCDSMLRTRTGTRKRDGIAPALASFHWLAEVWVVKAFHGLAPLSALCPPPGRHGDRALEPFSIRCSSSAVFRADLKIILGLLKESAAVCLTWPFYWRALC